MIDGVVAPVDQRFPVAEDDVSVMLDPAQKADGPVIVGVAGAGFEETSFAAEVVWHPFTSVTVTV